IRRRLISLSRSIAAKLVIVGRPRPGQLLPPLSAPPRAALSPAGRAPGLPGLRGSDAPFAVNFGRYCTPGMISTVPPAASILARAEAVTACARTVSRLSSSPSPRTLNRSECFSCEVRPRWITDARSTVAPESNARFRSPTLMIVWTLRKFLWLTPRLGMRRTSGIWPPSQPTRIDQPERAFAPLWPRDDVLPWPLPGPRPTRLRGL